MHYLAPLPQTLYVTFDPTLQFACVHPVNTFRRYTYTLLSYIYKAMYTNRHYFQEIIVMEMNLETEKPVKY